MGLEDNLERVGHILEAGFGDKFLMGFILQFLDIKTPQQCYKAIEDKHQPLEGVSEKAWQYLRKLAQKANPDDICTERVIEELRNRRLDLLMVLINHPDGIKWLESQMSIVRQKLALEPTKTP